MEMCSGLDGTNVSFLPDQRIVEDDFGLSHVTVGLRYQNSGFVREGRLAYWFAVDNNTVAAHVEIKTVCSIRVAGWAPLVY